MSRSIFWNVKESAIRGCGQVSTPACGYSLLPFSDDLGRVLDLMEEYDGSIKFLATKMEYLCGLGSLTKLARST